MNWTLKPTQATPHPVQATREILNHAIDAWQDGSQTPSALQTIAMAIGQLLIWREEVEVTLPASLTALAEHNSDLIEALPTSLPNGEELTDQALRILALAEDFIYADSDEQTAITKEITIALTKRTEHFKLVQGLQHLNLNHKTQSVLSDSKLCCYDGFDTVLRGELWRLITFNSWREEQLADIHPDYRKACWWLFGGVAIPHNTISNMGDVADLLSQFPEARGEFNGLMQGASLLQDRCMTRRYGALPDNVISIRDYLQKRQQEMHRVGTTPNSPNVTLSVAAADDDPVEIYRTHDNTLVISICGDDLLVDYEPIILPKEGAPPFIQAQGEDTLKATAGDPGQFIFSLNHPIFSAQQAELVAPHVAGDVVIAIPFS